MKPRNRRRSALAVVAATLAQNMGMHDLLTHGFLLIMVHIVLKYGMLVYIQMKKFFSQSLQMTMN